MDIQSCLNIRLPMTPIPMQRITHCGCILRESFGERSRKCKQEISNTVCPPLSSHIMSRIVTFRVGTIIPFLQSKNIVARLLATTFAASPLVFGPLLIQTIHDEGLLLRLIKSLGRSLCENQIPFDQDYSGLCEGIAGP